jgi:psiF repeat-containing protein
MDPRRPSASSLRLTHRAFSEALMRMWPEDSFLCEAASVHQPSRSKEIAMKTLSALILAAIIGIAAPVAFADDTAAVKGRTGKIQTAAATTDASGTAKLSQQDKMRQCAKQATGKKGPERKAFMKGCLSKKKG